MLSVKLSHESCSCVWCTHYAQLVISQDAGSCAIWLGRNAASMLGIQLDSQSARAYLRRLYGHEAGQVSAVMRYGRLRLAIHPCFLWDAAPLRSVGHHLKRAPCIFATVICQMRQMPGNVTLDAAHVMSGDIMTLPIHSACLSVFIIYNMLVSSQEHTLFAGAKGCVGIL